mmetsp:Transcript_75231/g.218450  ORF Transcript_75231/g.218450 Transcript_75231/m.218450 type:complete len:202 (-) Transcript_75231:107-712(-)
MAKSRQTEPSPGPSARAPCRSRPLQASVFRQCSPTRTCSVHARATASTLTTRSAPATRAWRDVPGASSTTRAGSTGAGCSMLRSTNLQAAIAVGCITRRRRHTAGRWTSGCVWMTSAAMAAKTSRLQIAARNYRKTPRRILIVAVMGRICPPATRGTCSGPRARVARTRWSRGCRRIRRRPASAGRSPSASRTCRGCIRKS